MDSDIKPSTIMLIAGGAVLFISTLLEWHEFFELNGWDTDRYGLQGIVVAIIGIAVGGGVALTKFANVSMPERILGFDHDQLHLVLGFSAFLITFSLQFQDGASIGILLAWIASAVIVAGAYIDIQAGRDSSDGPPTQF